MPETPSKLTLQPHIVGFDRARELQTPNRKKKTQREFYTSVEICNNEKFLTLAFFEFFFQFRFPGLILFSRVLQLLHQLPTYVRLLHKGEGGKQKKHEAKKQLQNCGKHSVNWFYCFAIFFLHPFLKEVN